MNEHPSITNEHPSIKKNNYPLREDILAILRLLSSKDDLTQRDLSNHMGISLGKTNHLLKELAKIGLLEIRNFTVSGQKIQKIKYHLTKEGLEERIRLTYDFLKEKEAEYNNIRKEWECLNSHTSTMSKGD